MKEYKLLVADDGTCTLSLIPPPPPPPRFLGMRGCNLVGGDSYYYNWGSAGPVSGTNYKFISTAEVDKLIAAGMNTFRVVFTWEAVQPTPYAVLDTLSGNHAAYLGLLHNLVTYITSKGAKVLLDIHGGSDLTFAAYRGVKVGGFVGLQKVEDMLANLWGQLAKRYAANPLVMYGVTNEPQGIAAATWFQAAQKVIYAIRGQGGRQTIIMPGTDWTGAGGWMVNNANAWNLVDPANNLQVQLHLYLDANSGGGTTDIVSETIGVERLKAVTAWARYKGVKLFLGEIGMSASNPIAQATWNKTHQFMLDNADVFSGWAFWAAGEPAWWGGYKFYCGPGSAQLGLIGPALK